MPVLTKDKKLLFIHIPKTGGSAIEKHFVNNKWVMSHIGAGNKCSLQHQHKELLLDSLSIDSFDLIFTIVRDPVDRLLSEYRYKNPKKPLNTWVVNTLQQVENNRYYLDNHIRPQTEFLLPEIKLFYYESGLENICNCLYSYGIDIPTDSIAVDNKSRGSAKKEELSDNSLQLIHSFYRKDYDILGYKK
jgi:hypothetical protein